MITDKIFGGSIPYNVFSDDDTSSQEERQTRAKEERERYEKIHPTETDPTKPYYGIPDPHEWKCREMEEEKNDSPFYIRAGNTGSGKSWMVAEHYANIFEKYIMSDAKFDEVHRNKLHLYDIMKKINEII